jgi:hypothetical protein
MGGPGPFYPQDPTIPQRRPVAGMGQQQQPPNHAIKDRIQNRMGGTGAGEDRMNRFNRMSQPGMGGFPGGPTGMTIPPALQGAAQHLQASAPMMQNPMMGGVPQNPLMMGNAMQRERPPLALGMGGFGGRLF